MPRDVEGLGPTRVINLSGPFVVVPCYEHPECRGALTCRRPRRLVWLRRRIGFWLMLLGAFGLGYFTARATEPAHRVDERTP
jgi:hypothetical protein